MLESLKAAVYEANMELYRRNMIIYTWGNVSGIDRAAGIYAIKPSGVPYEELKYSDIVLVDLEGKKVEGAMNPSSDTPTHTYLYNAFPAVGGIVHTHSPYAVAFAQAGLDIDAYGTTHADYFYGPVPCARRLTPEEINGEYEKETGKVIAETFASLDPIAIPAALVAGHGPFAWGKNADEAVHNAVVLEETAKMAYLTMTLRPGAKPIEQELLDKHYLRKHGKNAYYGQNIK